MDAQQFSNEFEFKLRKLFPSLDQYNARPANNHILLSFGEMDDFLRAVRAASGANIAMEIGWLFRRPKNFGINSCYLKLQLCDQCLDDRLDFLLLEAAL